MAKFSIFDFGAKRASIALSLLVLLSLPALANDCKRMQRMGDEWDANLSAFSSAKQKYFALPSAQRVPARCAYWKGYQNYLRKAKQMIDEYDRSTCQGKFNKVECNSACFAARIQDAEKQTQRACSSASIARANACAAAVDKYSSEHDPLFEKLREMLSRASDLQFEKNDKAAAIKVHCERLKWSWTTYQPFLRRELKAMEDACGDELFDFFFADKRTFKGSEYFTRTQPAITRKELADLCRINADTLTPTPIATAPPEVAAPLPATTPLAPRLSRPSTSASCSDITGTSSSAPARQCAIAHKVLQTARSERTRYPQRATKSYSAAAAAYRQAGDHPRAALATLEATAKDMAPFIEAEAALAARKKNLDEAENNARIARKIELGAFESRSCADLQVAANYYLDAAKYFLRADEFAIVNALVLRKDHLERLVDEAKRKGLCGNRRLTARRTAAPTPVPDEPRIPDDQCAKIVEHIARTPDLLDGRAGAALKVELAAKGCRIPKTELKRLDCEKARVVWAVNGVSADEINRRVTAVGCYRPRPTATR